MKPLELLGEPPLLSWWRLSILYLIDRQNDPTDFDRVGPSFHHHLHSSIHPFYFFLVRLWAINGAFGHIERWSRSCFLAKAKIGKGDRTVRLDGLIATCVCYYRLLPFFALILTLSRRLKSWHVVVSKKRFLTLLERGIINGTCFSSICVRLNTFRNLK